MTKIEERIRAGLWGVLIGDAMGLPHQFKPPVMDHLEMVMPPSYSKTFPRIAYGTWSDDGALTLAMAHSLAMKGTTDPDDFGVKCTQWLNHGAYTVDRRAYDVGNTTSEAILKIIRGHKAEEAGLTQVSSNGNGSLMRTLPLALFHQGSDEELYTDACRLSAVTHGHDISKAACGVYCVAARRLLNGEPVNHAFVEALKLAHVGLVFPNPPAGSGYVLDSLAYAIQAARSGQSFEEVVVGAIRLGADTDTTAAIAGGLVAVRDGMAAIPERWMGALRGKDQAGDIIDMFVDARPR